MCTVRLGEVRVKVRVGCVYCEVGGRVRVKVRVGCVYCEVGRWWEGECDGEDVMCVL